MTVPVRDLLCRSSLRVAESLAQWLPLRPMPLTTEQLMSTMGLVDEIIDCNAQLYGCPDVQRRAELRSARSDRVERIKASFATADSTL